MGTGLPDFPGEGEPFLHCRSGPAFPPPPAATPDLLDDERLGQAGRARAAGGAAARTAIVAGQRVAASAAPGRPHAVRHGRLDGYDGGPGGLSAPEAPAQVLGVGDGRGAAAVQQRAFDERRRVAQRPGLARRQPADAAVGQRERRRPFVEPEVAVRRRHGVHLLGLPPRRAVPVDTGRPRLADSTRLGRDASGDGGGIDQNFGGAGEEERPDVNGATSDRSS